MTTAGVLARAAIAFPVDVDVGAAENLLRDALIHYYAAHHSNDGSGLDDCTVRIENVSKAAIQIDFSVQGVEFLNTSSALSGRSAAASDDIAKALSSHSTLRQQLTGCVMQAASHKERHLAFSRLLTAARPPTSELVSRRDTDRPIVEGSMTAVELDELKRCGVLTLVDEALFMCAEEVLRACDAELPAAAKRRALAESLARAVHTLVFPFGLSPPPRAPLDGDKPPCEGQELAPPPTLSFVHDAHSQQDMVAISSLRKSQDEVKMLRERLVIMEQELKCLEGVNSSLDSSLQLEMKQSAIALAERDRALQTWRSRAEDAERVLMSDAAKDCAEMGTSPIMQRCSATVTPDKRPNGDESQHQGVSRFEQLLDLRENQVKILHEQLSEQRKEAIELKKAIIDMTKQRASSSKNAGGEEFVATKVFLDMKKRAEDAEAALRERTRQISALIQKEKHR